MLLFIISLVAAFLAGATLWSFAEYATHNWYGHLTKGKNHFSRQHLKHHAKGDWFAPTMEKMGAAAKVELLLFPLAWLATSLPVAIAFNLGFLSAYMGYEILHRRLHTHAPINAYGRWARKHHFYHHFLGPNHNHGVSSPIWDIVFGTHVKVESKVRVPERHAMSWLVDPESGEVRERFQDDYEIARRGSKRRSRGD